MGWSVGGNTAWLMTSHLMSTTFYPRTQAIICPLANDGFAVSRLTLF